MARASIAAWREYCPTENLYPPLALDVRDPVWVVEQNERPEPLQNIDFKHDPIVAIVNINMIHIAPESACLGLMAGARRILPSGGFYIYMDPSSREAGILHLATLLSIRAYGRKTQSGVCGI